MFCHNNVDNYNKITIVNQELFSYFFIIWFSNIN